MSVMYCTHCDCAIDTDYDVEHFAEDGSCIKQNCAEGRHDMEQFRIAGTEDEWYRECVECGYQEGP